MNIRIKEIMEDCGFYVSAYASREVQQKEIEFLCESIVKECASKCVNSYDAQAIIKHFGLEE